MEEKDFYELKEKGKVETLEEKPETAGEVGEPDFRPNMEDYLTFLELLRQFKPHRNGAPTHKPKSFIEQIEFYDDGANRRVYLYIKDTWRYVALT